MLNELGEAIDDTFFSGTPFGLLTYSGVTLAHKLDMLSGEPHLAVDSKRHSKTTGMRAH